MSVKLKDNDIKKKIKVTFGEFQIITPEFSPHIYEELSQLIRDNSIEIKVEDDLGKILKDTQVNNTVKVMRYMLKNLTNIENDWDNIDDIQLDETLNYADGDFKEVVQTLMDVMMEIAHDNSRNDIRKISILTDKLVEFKGSMVNTVRMQQTLESLGLDMDKLIKMQQGDETIIKEFQDNIVKELEKQNKPKRQYTKKTKK
jgi:hypothetical protein